MKKAKNNITGIVHGLTGRKVGPLKMQETICGRATGLLWLTAGDELITCTKCRSVPLDKNDEQVKKRVCKYPKCFYYGKGAKYYCCSACSSDHWEDKRLAIEEREMEERRKVLIQVVKSYIGHIESNDSNTGSTYSLKLLELDKETLEALIYCVKVDNGVYEETVIGDTISNIIKDYCAYLKENLL